jgi:hypothetical protein
MMILIILAILIYRYPKIAEYLLGHEIYHGRSADKVRKAWHWGPPSPSLRWHQHHALSLYTQYSNRLLFCAAACL